MFNIGWSELLVIAVVAITVVGPKELPRMLRAFGQYTARLRRMVSEFQPEFNDLMRQAELDDMRKVVASVKDAVSPLNPSAHVKRLAALPNSKVNPVSTTPPPRLRFSHPAREKGDRVASSASAEPKEQRRERPRRKHRPRTSRRD
jgi:sec-independent protein translocase protein TatB